MSSRISTRPCDATRTAQQQHRLRCDHVSDVAQPRAWSTNDSLAILLSAEQLFPEAHPRSERVASEHSIQRCWMRMQRYFVHFGDSSAMSCALAPHVTFHLKTRSTLADWIVQRRAFARRTCACGGESESLLVTSALGVVPSALRVLAARTLNVGLQLECLSGLLTIRVGG
jgi:hypothetical protein